MVADFQEKTLLIVENNDALRNRLKLAPERRGFAARTAESVSEAMAQADIAWTDYAIIDLRLQDGSGRAVVEALEQRDPGIRAIILTGYGNTPTAVAAARIGAVDYMTKPATADEILDALMAPEGKRPPAPTDAISPSEAVREQMEHAYHETGENVSTTARLLHLHRHTLQKTPRRVEVDANATS